jgi:hypothetical protein
MQPLQSTTYPEPSGYSIRIDWYPDCDMGPPQDEHDGHGITRQGHPYNKAPGERALLTDGRHSVLYDIQATQRNALDEGWGLSPADLAALTAGRGRAPTRREIAARAVQLDFQYLQDWYADRWQWVGYEATILDPAGDTIHEDSLWGIESLSMAEVEGEALAECREWLANELDSQADAAARDIPTTPDAPPPVNPLHLIPQAEFAAEAARRGYALTPATL